MPARFCVRVFKMRIDVFLMQSPLQRDCRAHVGERRSYLSLSGAQVPVTSLLVPTACGHRAQVTSAPQFAGEVVRAALAWRASLRRRWWCEVSQPGRRGGECPDAQTISPHLPPEMASDADCGSERPIRARSATMTRPSGW